MNPPGHGLVVRDWVVAVAAAGLMSLRVAMGPTVSVSEAGQVATLTLAAATGAALVWRRRWPWPVAGIAVVASALYAVVAGPVVPVAGWLAVLVVSRHVDSLAAAVRGSVAAALAVMVGTAVGAAVHQQLQAVPLLVSLTLVVLLGAIIARLQTARRQGQREAERQRAVTDERLRIARDLHDVVGHGLSTIAVQSGTARLALTAGDTNAAQRAMAAVEAASRGALAEMRHTLGILRQHAVVADAAGLDGIDILVRDARAAGHPIIVDRRGPIEQVPPLAALTAYRVLQEAITNTIRHAPGASIAVELDASADHLMVAVTDDGAATEDRLDDGERTRYGLIGLRERVEAVGGTLEAGRRAEAPGWRVTARLPAREGTAA